jgi:hypothetical protein
MQLYVVVDDEDGSSRVVRSGPPSALVQMSGEDILRGAREPLAALPDAVDRGSLVAVDLAAVLEGLLEDVRIPAGPARWHLSIFGPATSAGMHRTPTLDYDVVTAGRVALLLDEGVVQLETGDAAILVGAHHGWRTGEEGASVVFTMVPLELGG